MLDAKGFEPTTRLPRAHGVIDKALARLRALYKYTRKPSREQLVDRLIERPVFVNTAIDKLAPKVF
jgi:hypothetical protein